MTSHHLLTAHSHGFIYGFIYGYIYGYAVNES